MYTNCTFSILLNLLSFVQVGVLDIDICGPSQPRVLGAIGEPVHESGSGWSSAVSKSDEIIYYVKKY